MTKTVMAAVCGRPNVGKSTLTNLLTGEKIAIVSDKPQTTRNRIEAIFQRGETQFILLDTPGFHKPKTRLGDYMVKVVNETVTDVDLALMVVEPAAKIGKQEEELLARLKSAGTPVILAINKIDTVEDKRNLLEVIAVYSEAFEFESIIPVSAKTGDGTGELVDEMEKYATEGPWLFPDDMITDQPERQICAEYIREKLLMCLDKEIPHGTAVEITKLKESHKRIIIGKGGSMLRKVGELARRDIEELTGMKVNLQTWVKVRENWRDSAASLRNFGYREN